MNLQAELNELQNQEKAVCAQATADLKARIAEIQKKIRLERQAERDRIFERTLAFTGRLAELFHLCATIKKQGLYNACVGYAGHVHWIECQVSTLNHSRHLVFEHISLDYDEEEFGDVATEGFDKVRAKLLAIIEEGNEQ